MLVISSVEKTSDIRSLGAEVSIININIDNSILGCIAIVYLTSCSIGMLFDSVEATKTHGSKVHGIDTKIL